MRSDEWPAWFFFWFPGCWRALAKGAAWVDFYTCFYCAMLLLILPFPAVFTVRWRWRNPRRARRAPLGASRTAISATYEAVLTHYQANTTRFAAGTTGRKNPNQTALAATHHTQRALCTRPWNSAWRLEIGAPDGGRAPAPRSLVELPRHRAMTADRWALGWTGAWRPGPRRATLYATLTTSLAPSARARR